jgi:hypothetical protein
MHVLYECDYECMKKKKERKRVAIATKSLKSMFDMRNSPTAGKSMSLTYRIDE